MLLNNLNPFPEAAILDMDGVLWRSDQPLCDLNLLFNNFSANHIKVILATNNATGTVDFYLEKIKSMGAQLESWQIVSAAMATAYLLKSYFPNGGPVFIIGSPALNSTLADYGFFHSKNQPLAVIAGMDREITYEKIHEASAFVRMGLPFFGTNPDPTYPTPNGLAPGAGTCIAAVEAAAGKKALLAGKPNTYLFTVAMDRCKSKPETTLVVGDRIETDILGGIKAGCKTALVLTGISSQDDLGKWDFKPDLVINNIMDLFAN